MAPLDISKGLAKALKGAPLVELQDHDSFKSHAKKFAVFNEEEECHYTLIWVLWCTRTGNRVPKVLVVRRL